ncbi:flavin reductase family protein [uncultured Sulfitobacter sp.]|uniref:flavin reductase family protein n=1 Tax=uncultured Sulfitobacter sp. TaxID=191468 RepID=UPI002608013F|nr:flavin reductase family protein [uncultured Sulfitobacter sp.]
MAPLGLMETELPSFIPDTDNTDDLRRAFGQFGTGVTLVTTQTAVGPLGMTANSFSSVSLDPALVLWSAACSSKRHDIFAEATQFCIHILGSDQIDIANHFALRGDGFDEHDWVAGPNGAPTMRGCLATFHCDTHAIYPAGDHSIIVGKVTQAAVHSTQRDGLMFDRGRFGRFRADQ